MNIIIGMFEPCGGQFFPIFIFLAGHVELLFFLNLFIVYLFTNFPLSSLSPPTPPRYTVSLREGSVSCDTGHHNVSNGEVGACQVKVAPKCSSSCVYVLGYRGVNSSAVSLVDGVVTAEYRNGDKCKHEDNLWRQAVSRGRGGAGWGGVKEGVGRYCYCCM